MANDSKTFDLIQEDTKDILTGLGPIDFDAVWDRVGGNSLNRYDRTFYAFIAGGLSAINMVDKKQVGNHLVSNIDLDYYTEVMREATLKILHLNEEVQILKREVLRYERGY